jgi:hypothetical protein
VAFEVFKAHFYVLPLVVNSVSSEFALSPIAAARTFVKVDSETSEWKDGTQPTETLALQQKTIEIETETEVTQTKRQSSNFSMSPYSGKEISEMKTLLDALHELIT